MEDIAEVEETQPMVEDEGEMDIMKALQEVRGIRVAWRGM